MRTGTGTEIKNFLRLLDWRQVKAAFQHHVKDVMAVRPEVLLAN